MTVEMWLGIIGIVGTILSAILVSRNRKLAEKDAAKAKADQIEKERQEHENNNDLDLEHIAAERERRLRDQAK